MFREKATGGRRQRGSVLLGARKSRVAGAVLLVVLGWGGSAAAEEQESPCSDTRVVVQGRLSGEWARALRDLCGSLSKLRGMDSDTRLRFTPAGSDLIAEVVHPDGQSALRRVTSVPDLPYVVEALLNAPSDSGASEPLEATEDEPADEESSPAGEQEASGSERAEVISHRRAPRVYRSAARRTATPELGLGLRGDVSGPRTHVPFGVAGYAGLRASDWLLGLSLRWQAYYLPQPEDYPEFTMSGTAVGAFMTCRIAQGSMVALDLGPAAWVIAESQSVLDTSGSRDRTVADWGADTRIGLVARLLLFDPPWRLLISVDPEMSPTRVQQRFRLRSALPELPAWSLGFGLGAAWAER